MFLKVKGRGQGHGSKVTGQGQISGMQWSILGTHINVKLLHLRNITCIFILNEHVAFIFRYAHKHTVMEVQWNQNGNWLLTASRDHLVKLFDIRNMKEELQTFKGHKKEATSKCVVYYRY